MPSSRHAHSASIVHGHLDGSCVKGEWITGWARARDTSGKIPDLEDRPDVLADVKALVALVEQVAEAFDDEGLADLVAHDPKDCENCAEYQAEFLTFARDALPKIARGYIELVRTSLEAFENAKLRGRFLADLEEENARLQKELTAREAELEELQSQPVKRKWLR